MFLGQIDMWQSLRIAASLGITLTAMADDLHRFKISNCIILSGACVAAVLAIVEMLWGRNVESYILGGIGGFGFMLAAYAVRAVGAADVKLCGILGFLLGFSHVFFILLCSFLFTGIAGGIGVAARKLPLLEEGRRYHVIHFSIALLFGEGLMCVNIILKGGGLV